MIPPCLYIFEECDKENVIYQLDFPNVRYSDKTSYIQLFNDCGWEYVGDCLNWSYFRKSVQAHVDLSIFSDSQSKVDMINRIFKTRMLPLLVVFCACVVPQMKMLWVETNSFFENILLAVILFMFMFYVYLLVHCGLKLKKMKEELENE